MGVYGRCSAGAHSCSKEVCARDAVGGSCVQILPSLQRQSQQLCVQDSRSE